jgi:DNA-binding NarL/FixJ family response regulator
MTDPRTTVRPVVLLVDDHPGSVGPLLLSLESAGYSVVVALDGEAALERLDLVLADAVLLDAVMPGLSGFDTCRRIKANPALAHLPVIFMTGLADTEHIVSAFDSGGVDYVVKPVKVDEVLARLQAHIRNAKVARLAREAADVAGFGVVLTDSQGRIAWQSPRARQWLLESAANTGIPVIPAMASGSVPLQGHPGISARNLGPVGLGETMLLLAREETRSGDAARLAQAALTPRESEVLSWLAKGKTNKDIADILGLSPRTVNKHLEHIFDKLGVETRSAAAAIGARFQTD